MWRQCLQRSEVPGGRGVRQPRQLSRTLAKRMMPPECVDGVASAMLLVCAPAALAPLLKWPDMRRKKEATAPHMTLSEESQEWACLIKAVLFMCLTPA